MSPSLLSRERKRVAEDWQHACETYYRIKDRQRGGEGLLRWNKAQKKLAAVILGQLAAGKPPRIVLLKARQFGGSTLLQSFFYWWASTRRNVTGITVSFEKESSHHLAGMARAFYRGMPPEMRPMKEYDTRELMSFANPDSKTRNSNPGLNSKLVTATAGSLAKDQGMAGAVNFKRSQTFDMVHLSEVAFWPDARRLAHALLASVPDRPGTAIFWESSANLKGDFWYQQCKRAMAGESEYAFVFVPWFEAEEYALPNEELKGPLDERERWLKEQHGLTDGQIAWRRKEIKRYNGDIEAFLREYPEDPESCFSVTGSAVFGPMMKWVEESKSDPLIVGDLVEKRTGDPFVVIERKNAEFRVFELPKAGDRYAVGADVSEGMARDSDYSAAVVVDSMGRVVATWKGREHPGAFGRTLEMIARYYNGAFLAPEANGPGLVVLEYLFGNYPNLFTRRIVDGRPNTRSDRLGWQTNVASKSLMINRLRQHFLELKDEGVAIRDDRLIMELGTYCKTMSSFGAADGCNDDLVMAYAIALQAIGDTACNNVIQIGGWRRRYPHRAGVVDLKPDVEHEDEIQPLPRLGWLA